MDPKEELDRLIADNGGKKIRWKRHDVYKFPNGLVFTVSKTPECPFGFKHAVDDLKNFLGLRDDDRGKPGARREKKRSKEVVVPRRFQLEATPHVPTLRDKLASVKNTLPPTYARYTPPPPTPRPTPLPTFEKMMLTQGVRKLQQ